MRRAFKRVASLLGICAALMVSAAAFAFPEPYCTRTFSSSIEPITHVNFATIDNASTPTVNTPPANADEDFTAIVGQLAPGATYNVIAQGNSDGATFLNVYRAYVDWNHDGVFNEDASERYELGSITGSTGADGKQTSAYVTVPAGALTGATRVRVVKNYNAAGTACTTSAFGQAEDYTVNVDAANPTPTALPTLAKTFSPTNADVSQSAQLTLTLGQANASSGSLTLTADLVDTLPAGMTVATAPNATTTCPSGVVTATGGGASIGLATGAQIPPGGCVVSASVITAAAGIYTNTIAANSLKTDSGNYPATVAANYQSTSPGVATYAVGFETPTFTTGNLGTKGGWAVAGSGSVAADWKIVTTNPSAGVQNLRGTWTAAGTAGTTTIALSPTQGRGTTAYSVASADIAITPNATSTPFDFAPQDTDAGLIVTRVRFNNDAARNIQILDPATLTYVNTGTTWPSSTYFNVAVVARRANSTYQICLNGTSVYSGTGFAPNARNVAIVGTKGAGTNGTIIDVDNLVIDNVNAPACGMATDNPTLAKNFAPASVVINNASTATVTLSNPSSVDATLTSALVDTLPAGLVASAASTTCPTGAASFTSGTLSLAAGAKIPANGSCTLTGTVQSSTAGSYVNMLAAGSLQTSNGGNASAASATLTVLPLAPTVAKSFAPTTVGFSTDSTATITLSNANAAAITLTADLVDTLPTGLVATAASTTCGGVASFTASSLTLASGATIPANGSCTLSGTVHSDSSGSFVNTITTGALQTSAGTNAAAASATLTVTGGNSAIFSNPTVTTIPDAIYDGSLGSMGCSTIDASSIPSVDLITSISLTSAIAHTYVGDLVAKLVAPNGTVLGLFSQPGVVEAADNGATSGGDSSNVLATFPLTFSDAGANDPETMGSTLGTDGVICRDDGLCAYRVNPGAIAQPPATFADLNGGPASGTWQLCVGDTAAGDTGNFSWNITIGHAQGTPTTHTVTPSVATPSGAIAPATAQTVNDGATTTFTLTPDAGFHIDNVGGTCGGTLNGSVYTTAAVTADCTVIANFAADGGSPQPVFYNGALTTTSATFANPGGSTSGTGVEYYCAQQFTVDATGAYVIETTSPNTTGTPSNALDTYLRLYADTFDPAAPTGAIGSNDDFSGTLTVLPGPYAGTVTATATGFQGAQPGSRLAPANLTAGTSYFLVQTSFRATDFVGTVTEGQATGPFYTGIGGPGNITLVGTCAAVGGGSGPFTVTPSVATSSGQIAPATPQTVNAGATTTFTLTPDAGFHIDNVGGTCGGALNGSVFTTAAVSANCTVIANFAADGGGGTHTVTPSVGTPSGSIDPATPQTVNDGATTTFTLTPDAGFRIDNVGGTCGGTLNGSGYTTAPITTDCTVIANFAAIGSGGLVCSGPINHVIASDIDGSYFGWESGFVGDDSPGTGNYNFNPYGSSGNLAFYWGGAAAGNAGVAASATGTDWLVLQQGAVIGPSSTFSPATGTATNWDAGVDGYLGFAYPCAATGTCYGYTHMTTTAATGFPATLVDYCYDPTGAAVTIGAGPPPGNDPSATVTPTSLSFTVDENATATQTINIANAIGSDALTYAITAQASRPTLKPHARGGNIKAKLKAGPPNADLEAKLLAISQKAANTLASSGAPVARRTATPWVPNGSLVFELDDGTSELFFGLGVGPPNPPPATEAGAVFINRFSATDALTVDSISIYWGDATDTGSSMQGLQANLVVYYDADGDGDVSNAARVGSDDLVTITTLGDFQTYTTNFSIPAAGDVYIGFVDQWALAGGYEPRIFPGAIDNSSASQGMSYLSGAGTPPTDINNLANNDLTGVIDDLSASLAGNLLIRATGTAGGGGGACTGPVITWLTAAPATGSVAGGDNADVTITANPAAGGLTAGDYTGELCITSNDPTQPLISVPVALTVTAVAPDDGIFCSGFENGEDGSCGGGGTPPGNLVTGTINQPVTDDAGDGSSFDFTTGDYHPYDGSITSDDINLYDLATGSTTDPRAGMYAYWYADSVPAEFADQVSGVLDAGGVDVAVLHSGDTIGPASSIGGNGFMTNWVVGADGYIGVAFYNESTNAVNYGYIHMTTTSPTGFPAQVFEYGYDPTGAAVTIP